MLKSSTNTIWTNMLHHIKLTWSSNLTSTYSFIQIYRGVLVSLVINYTLVFAYVGQDSRSRPHEPFGHCSEILAGQKVQCAKYTHLKTCCRISTGKRVVVLFVLFVSYYSFYKDYKTCFIILVGTDVCVRLVFVWEETENPESNLVTTCPSHIPTHGIKQESQRWEASAKQLRQWN